jgi:RHS repeat-associated protein
MVEHNLGSIRGWFLPTSETEVAMQQFTPYRTRVPIDSTFPNPLPSYGWTDREYDAETGFYYLRARYYDPTELRFIQEDPSGYSGGPNVYAYVGGAVLSATDRSGMRADFNQEVQLRQWWNELTVSEVIPGQADDRAAALLSWADAEALRAWIHSLTFTIEVSVDNADGTHSTQTLHFAHGLPDGPCQICTEIPAGQAYMTGFIYAGGIDFGGSVTVGEYVDATGFGDFATFGAGVDDGESASGHESYGPTPGNGHSFSACASGSAGPVSGGFCTDGSLGVGGGVSGGGSPTAPFGGHVGVEGTVTLGWRTGYWAADGTPWGGAGGSF